MMRSASNPWMQWWRFGLAAGAWRWARMNDMILCSPSPGTDASDTMMRSCGESDGAGWLRRAYA